jgi:hypothetical protein
MQCDDASDHQWQRQLALRQGWHVALQEQEQKVVPWRA